jgi:hypothetical protein
LIAVIAPGPAAAWLEAEALGEAGADAAAEDVAAEDLATAEAVREGGVVLLELLEPLEQAAIAAASTRPPAGNSRPRRAM